MSTLGTWLAAHPELHRLDRELLLCRAAGLTRAQLLAHPERALEDAVACRLGKWAARRCNGEPLAYILGEREFWGRVLEVSPAVLVPRPETELLVEVALSRPRTTSVLELGTGSGAIAIALATQWPATRITATDVSPAALAVAQRNGRRHGVDVRWLAGDWFEPVRGRFDLIVANPPYVAESDPHLAALAHEPRAALVAGSDGLAAIRRIITAAGDHLERAGMLALEHGCDQGSAVRKLMQAAGFEDVATRCDLAGLERVTAGRLPGGRS